ncbi:hypothetical protein [Micromonospora chokoriensis]|uniref:GDT1 family protein n=1 Tax=Micromonospora chokoriensis TaxID=356851 RepID=A0A1C4X3C0_9ACTN|nr:hypothetical protein [Micromonospora chokoriensis]SCF02894.1 hypothetical protein GA0070612_3154 [Micromonospora chokoriensis]
MIDLFSTAAGAAVVFAATDIDDIVILTLFFVAARATGRPGPWQIVAGRYVGIGALAWLGGHPGVVRLVARTGHWLVPTIFIGIGVVILVSSGVPGRLVDLLG